MFIMRAVYKSIDVDKSVDADQPRIWGGGVSGDC